MESTADPIQPEQNQQKVEPRAKQTSPKPLPSSSCNSGKPTKSSLKRKVLYPYDSQMYDELTLRPRELITIEDESDSAELNSLWLWGVNEQGFRGLFYQDFTTESTESKPGTSRFHRFGKTPENRITYKLVTCYTDSKPPDDLECIVCKNLASEPHQATCCGRTVCYRCAEKWRKRNDSCPQCKQSPLKMAANSCTKHRIENLPVYCKHYHSGCEWKGNMDAVKDHLDEDCQFEDVWCDHDDCEEKIQRRYLQRHAEEECSHRPVKCPCCDEYGFDCSQKHLTYLELVRDHHKECLSWPRRCPNHCDTEEKLTRSTLQDHIDKNCPEQVISCQFAKAGCTVRVKRREMADHIQKAVGEHNRTA